MIPTKQENLIPSVQQDEKSNAKAVSIKCEENEQKRVPVCFNYSSIVVLVQ